MTEPIAIRLPMLDRGKEQCFRVVGVHPTFHVDVWLKTPIQSEEWALEWARIEVAEMNEREAQAREADNATALAIAQAARAR